MARDRELRFCWAGAGGQPPAPRGEWAHLKKLEPILLSAVLTVSLHAAMLSVPVRNEAVLDSPPGSAGTRPTSVRMLTLADRPFTEGGVPAQLHPSPTVLPDPTAGSSSQPDAAGGHRPAPTAAVPAPPVRGVVFRLPGVLGDDDFFARSALDVGPYPAQPVLIDYPSVDAGSGTHVSELSLFIDENGRVVRIRVDGPALPAAMEEAARLAFMGATFSPGQVDGLPVRSRIRVEVIFEEGSARR
jgi:protein TonB